MRYSYIYEPRALLEYLEALDWYLDRSINAAADLETAMNSKIVSICTQPTSYKKTKKNFREAILNKYPYSIVFFVEEEIKTVVIISVFHHRKDPETKFVGRQKH